MQYHQAVWYHPMGNIVLNPAWQTTCDQSNGYMAYCREADVALGAYSYGLRADYKVAETSTIGTGESSGNLTTGNYWTMLGPERNASGTAVSPPLGTTLYKTGEKTGTTSGPLIATCAYVGPDLTYHSGVYCANVAEMYLEPGDSGGPVYYFKFPYQAQYRVPEGIVFGRSHKAHGAVPVR
jgi:hypothetical protein